MLCCVNIKGVPLLPPQAPGGAKNECVNINPFMANMENYIYKMTLISFVSIPLEF